MKAKNSLCMALAMLGSCLAALMAAPAAQGAVLAEDGQPRAAVVVAPGLPAPIGAAVEDLVRIVERTSGARLPVVASAEETDLPARIWVGPHEGLEARFPGVDIAVPGFEEVLIACRGDDVLILGHDEVVEREGRRPAVRQAGTSLAVYAFLERELGVRWLWPGELGEDVLESPTVRLDEFTWRHVPPRQRMLRIANHSRGVEAYRGPRERAEAEAIARQLDEGVSNWHRRMRGNFSGPTFRGSANYFRMMQAGHAFTQWWDLYGEEHPEYFALQPDGTRGTFPRKSYLKLCIANPDVAERWLENAVGVFERDPSRLVVSASPNDGANSGKCWCDTCRSWDAPEGSPITLVWRGKQKEHVALTDRYVRFWNILARGLQERLPEREAFVGVWAYGTYRFPPIHQSLEPNVMVGYVGWPGEDWQAWARQTEHLFWRPNLFHTTWGLPAVFPRGATEAFGLMADNLSGVDVDSIYNHWSAQGISYYALAQLSWNPRQDADALIQDYVERAFGEQAAPHMLAFYGALENAYNEMRERTAGMHHFQRVTHYPEVYHAELLGEMEALLENARAAVAGPRAELHRRRLDFAAVSIQFARAQTEAISAMADLRLGRGRMEDIVARAFETSDAVYRILEEQLGTYAMSGFNHDRGYYRDRMDAYIGPPGEEYRAMLEPAEGVTALPVQWQFLLDPEGEGAEARWFDPAVAGTLEWDAMQVTSPWGEQLPTLAPDDPPGTRVYHGVAWYRTAFEADALEADEEAWLEFGAVDETCWVYLNGRKVGGQVYDGAKDRDAWRKPRRFGVANFLREGENDLVVKVQALAGLGGITRPVRLIRSPRNMVRNPGFQDGMEGWSFRLFGDRHAGLEERASRGMALGKYVEENALEVNLERARRRPDVTWPFAQVRQHVRQPMRQGAAYEVRVRYRQTVPGNLGVNDRPIRLRLYGRGDFEPDRQDRFWLSSPPHSSGDWDYLAGVFEAPRDYDSFGLTLFFGEPGLYQVDEFIVRESRQQR